MVIITALLDQLIEKDIIIQNVCFPSLIAIITGSDAFN